MAQILGKSGRYVTDQARNKRMRIVMIATAIIAVAGALEGIVIASYLPPMPFNSWLRVAILSLILILLFLFSKWSKDRVTKLEREEKNYERGLIGENIVSQALARFPNDFYILNDVSTDFGNLDHVVIGPTGIYAIDAKNWRGIVNADGKDELLLNGKPTNKSECKNFVRRMMAVKEKVDTLTGSEALRFQALFAFTSAWVDKIWGKTGNVNCLRDDQLYDYIVEKDFGTKLTPEQTQKIARAFAQLAHMEVDFTKQA